LGLRDLTGARSWTIALLVGTVGLLSNLAIGLAWACGCGGCPSWSSAANARQA
jgi:hypothetical protein